jgi:hypothetical protein
MEETMLRITFSIVIAGLALSGAPVGAQDSSGPSDSARYTFYRVQDIFIRLDVRTGQVSQCGWVSTGWFCRVMPDEHMALESEIARLQTSNSALKKELLARDLPLPDGIKPDPPVSRGNEMKSPSVVDLDRMMVFMEKTWRRMVDMMVNLQRDVLRRG